jgi:hypothetical protein
MFRVASMRGYRRLVLALPQSATLSILNTRFMADMGQIYWPKKQLCFPCSSLQSRECFLIHRPNGPAGTRIKERARGSRAPLY